MKLTDISAFGGTLSGSDLIHIVDVSDISQDPAGSSFKLSLSQLASISSLSAVLTAGNTTGAQTIESDNGKSILSILDTFSSLLWNNPSSSIYATNFVSDASTSMIWDQGGAFGGSIVIDATSMSLFDRDLIQFDAPIYKFLNDASNRLDLTVGATGIVTAVAVGSANKFVFGSGMTNIQPGSQFNIALDVGSGYDGFTVGNGSKQIYIRNNGSIFGLDAYDYGTSTALDFFIGINGQKISIGNTSASGYVGIGFAHNQFASIDSILTVQLDGNGSNFYREGNTANVFFSTHSTNANGSIMSFKKSRGNSKSVPTTILNGDTIGEFVAYPYDGTSYITSGKLSFVSNGTVAAGSVPTDLVFTLSGVEKMRLKNSGVLNIASIPTSSAGLVAGDIWSNLGILTIV